MAKKIGYTKKGKTESDKKPGMKKGKIGMTKMMKQMEKK